MEPATSSSFLDSTIIQKTEFLLTKCVRINTNKMRLLPIDISKLPVFIVIEMLMNTFLSCTQQDLVDSFEVWPFFVFCFCRYSQISSQRIL